MLTLESFVYKKIKYRIIYNKNLSLFIFINGLRFIIKNANDEAFEIVKKYCNENDFIGINQMIDFQIMPADEMTKVMNVKKLVENYPDLFYVKNNSFYYKDLDTEIPIMYSWIFTKILEKDVKNILEDEEFLELINFMIWLKPITRENEDRVPTDDEFSKIVLSYANKISSTELRNYIKASSTEFKVKSFNLDNLVSDELKKRITKL